MLASASAASVLLPTWVSARSAMRSIRQPGMLRARSRLARTTRSITPSRMRSVMLAARAVDVENIFDFCGAGR
jgi:hypothetical protein